MSRFTKDDFARIIGRPGYSAVAPGVRHAESQLDARQEPLGLDQAQAPGPASIAVRITRYGSRFLDADNCNSSVKFVCDALRYSGLIPDDNPEAIELQVSQRKIKKALRGTLIEITYH